MAIFPVIELEDIVQVDDKTRLDAAKTFTSKDGPTIVKVEIQPYAAGPWIEVTGTKSSDWFTDWQYDTAGTKAVSLRVNDPGGVTVSKNIEVLTAVDDALFSSDPDLEKEEPDILKYVRKGRSSFKDIHREAQRQIMQFFDDKGYVDASGAKLTKDAVVDVSEVREWSKYLALYLIFSALSNQNDDIFSSKASFYHSKMLAARQKNAFRLDLDGDGEISEGERLKLSTSLMQRR